MRRQLGPGPRTLVNTLNIVRESKSDACCVRFGDRLDRHGQSAAARRSSAGEASRTRTKNRGPHGCSRMGRGGSCRYRSPYRSAHRWTCGSWQAKLDSPPTDIGGIGAPQRPAFGSNRSRAVAKPRSRQLKQALFTMPSLLHPPTGLMVKLVTQRNRSQTRAMAAAPLLPDEFRSTESSAVRL